MSPITMGKGQEQDDRALLEQLHYDVSTAAFACALQRAHAELDATRAALASAHEAVRLLAEAAFALVTEVMAADAREDLGDVDMRKVEALRGLLVDCSDCDGMGTRDKLPHDDEEIAAGNVCPTCNAWGFLPRVTAITGGTPGEPTDAR